MGEEIAAKEMLLCAAAQFLMMAEVGSVCFLMSAFSRKIQIGAGLGIALVFFALDLMCRIIPAIESAHAVAYAMKTAPQCSKDKIIVITISGRGDKDCAAIARYRGEDIHE